MTTVRTSRSAVVVVLATVVLGGCSGTVGGSGHPAPAVTAAPLGTQGSDAKAALALMKSDMMGVDHGFRLSFGSATGLSIDSRYQGDDGRSTLTISGGRCELIGIGGTAWAKADASFWAVAGGLDSDQVAAVTGRWVTVSGPLASFAEYVDADALLSSLAGSDDAVFGSTSPGVGGKVQQIEIGQSAISVSVASPHLLRSFGIGTTVTYPDDDLHVAKPSPVVDLPK